MSKPKLHKFTPGARRRFVEGIRLGATVTMACNFAGFGRSCFYQAMERGRQNPDSLYGEFVADVDRAKGQAAIGWLAKIEKAANDGAWQAAAWKLERRYPDDYGRRVQEVRHSGQVETGPDVSQMAEDIAKRIWERRNRPADVE